MLVGLLSWKERMRVCSLCWLILVRRRERDREEERERIKNNKETIKKEYLNEAVKKNKTNDVSCIVK